MMWARVKGRTENDLMKLPFKDVYAFRPAIMQATKGLKNALPAYKYMDWLIPIFRPIFPDYFGTFGQITYIYLRLELGNLASNELLTIHTCFSD